jgi:hypothetical protein
MAALWTEDMEDCTSSELQSKLDPLDLEPDPCPASLAASQSQVLVVRIGGGQAHRLTRPHAQRPYRQRPHT